MKTVSSLRLVFSCEHGGHDIPAAYRRLFQDKKTLESHRGWDAGALQLARQLAAAFNAPLHSAIVSRLLVDLNRSPHHRHLLSEFTRPLDTAERTAILQKYYRPYREAVQKDIEELLKQRHTVLHISVHSFTPQLDGAERTADIGLLYDPRREQEQAFCQTWRNCIKKIAPALRARRNYPYTGVQDGFIPALRKLFPDPHYIGVELETNQRFVQQGGPAWDVYRVMLSRSLREAVDAYRG